ncbi:MAG: xanthine dehydrogenase family protein molybdopterin-binding subunit, partial [Pseudolabrys sp.]
MSAKQKFIGRSVPRLEDRPLLTGQGRFAADISFPGQWTMRVVRSPAAHGNIRSIDASAALTLPGVHAIWTHADVAQIPPIPFRLTGLKQLEPYRQLVLAKDVVRYVGEPIAAIFAENAYVAEDAAELLELSIESLEATMLATAPPGSYARELTTEPGVLRKTYGDVDAAFRDAHAVISLELSIGRHSGVPLETRGAIARYDEPRDVLELHGAAKVPHWNRDTIAQMLGRKKETVQLYEGHVGGGFGIRGEIYPEDVLVCAAALNFKRPIKWIEDRREHLIAANHSREQHHHIRAAIDAQGRILGVDDEFFHDNGAYMRTHAATVPDLAAAMLPGPYRVPAYRATAHIRLTNKTPCGTYRAPGRYESTFVRERLLDAIAAKVGVDKVEIRKRNLINKSAMPYTLGLDTLGTQIVYDSGDYAMLLDKALKAAGWDDLQKQLGERRKNGETVGAGVAMFVEKSGLGPFDTVRVEIKPDGKIEVITGVASIGQGVETVIAQICADTLGVDYANIRVTHGQTDRIARGMGAFASRVTVMCGEATRLAADKLRTRVLEAAAELMQSRADALDIVNGDIVRAHGPGPSMPLAELARTLPDGLSAEDTFESTHMVYPYGVHVAAVRVDTDTGNVAIERYVIAYDIGKAVNPKLVEGQIAGG